MKTKINLHVTGMTCVNCANAITRKVQKIEGLEDVSADFINSSVKFGIVSGNKEEKLQQAIAGIEKLGYKVIQDDNKEQDSIHSLYSQKISIVIMAILSIVSLGLEMLVDNNFTITIVAVLTAIVIFYFGNSFYKHAFKSIKSFNFDMSVLVVLGSSVSFFYSLFAFIFPHLLSTPKYLYFSSGAMIVTFVSIGKYLEEQSKTKASHTIKQLIDLAPKKATILTPSGSYQEINAKDLKLNDILVVTKGQNIPADGIIVKGSAELDMSFLTGESMPVLKQEQDLVYTGSTNLNGVIQVQVTKNSNDTLLAQILNLLQDASVAKIPIARLADRVSSIFVPTVIAIAIAVFFTWWIIDKNLSFAIVSAVNVLIISCPCALGLATPIAIVCAMSGALQNSIVIKNPKILEILPHAKFIFFDKTGTLTTGNITVTQTTLDKDTLLQVATIEALNTHPISKAIVSYARAQNLNITTFNGKIEHLIGLGVSAITETGDHVLLGNTKLLDKYKIPLTIDQNIAIEQLISKGYTVNLCSINNQYLGYLAFSDTFKPQSQETIKNLKAQGLNPIMLTGDSDKVAQTVAHQLGIDKVYANVLPDTKYTTITSHQKQGAVIFVGDGINDAPSIKQADVGIVMTSGADVTKQSGDIILMNNNLEAVVTTLKLAHKTMTVIKENLFWAFGYNVIFIPIAAGILYPFFGIMLNPVFSAIAMSCSSICVVMNSLRLRSKKV